MHQNLQVKIPVKAARSYPILIEPDLLKNWQKWLEPYCHSGKILIISDNKVANLYGGKFCDHLVSWGYQVKLLEFPAGEQSKTINTKLKLEEQMFAFGCDRHTLCLALGGGVVGDLAGFTAATYMRGIDYIQIPTSLLAMIDSSVGGKTAVNTSYGKNIIGAFWQPKAVIMDLALLKSLPREHIINGFFEAIKIFLALDWEYFEFCVRHLTEILDFKEKFLAKIIRQAVALKAHVVEVDEEERNLRMILNYGHTAAHAIEKLTDYKILHGYAVGLGMLVEAKIAEFMGYLAAAEFNLIADFLAKLEIPHQILRQYSPNAIVEAMYADKKNKNKQIVMVLLTGIGKVKNADDRVAFPVEEVMIIKAVQFLQESISIELEPR